MKPRHGLAASTLLALVCAPAISAARDECHTLNAGYIHSGTWGRAPAAGNGAEVSFMLWPWCTSNDGWQMFLGLGGFAQAESIGFDHGRYALGVQAGHFLGVEAGWSLRERSAEFGLSHGPHLGLFLSAAIITLAFRMSILALGEGPTYGVDPALVLGVKIPIPGLSTGEPAIHNWKGFGSSRSGRPLRDVDGRPCLARTTTQSRGSKTRKGHAADRGRAWLADARAEDASVPAFRKLAIELALLGAPVDLVARCCAAAHDEERHARVCLALANRWSGESHAIHLFGDVAVRFSSLRELAVQSAIDGCIGEGIAAAMAHEAAARSDDEVEARALSMIARDEASHAWLARDILRWALCEDENGETRRAVDLAVRRRLDATCFGEAVTSAPYQMLSTRRSSEVSRAVVDSVYRELP